MKISAELVSTVLFATSALAAPRRISRRSRHTHPLIPGVAPHTPAAANANATYNVQYSSNWAGAVITSPPSGTTFNSVSGVFNVPQPQPPTSGDGSWSGCAWVGIDGDTYGNAILQAGADWTVTSSGGSLSYSYTPWIEWYPVSQVNVDNFSFSSGDSLLVTCTATSSTDGNCYFENQSTGQSTTAYVSAPDSNAALGGQNAEWIVEDYSSGGSLVPFANFGTVSFSSCTAGTTGGSADASSATPFDITDSNGNVIAASTINDASDVSITWQ